MNKTRQTWSDMRQRCYNPNAQQFKNYGARGIQICARWFYFQNFLDDMGERPTGLTIERKDNNGHYMPSNCLWATRAEQRRNQRGNRILAHDGKSMTIEEWGREIGRHPTTIRSRLKRGYSIRFALEPTLLPRGRAAMRKEK